MNIWLRFTVGNRREAEVNHVNKMMLTRIIGIGCPCRQPSVEEFTSAANCPCQAYRWHPGTVLSKGDWSFGEGYAHDIIGDLNRGAVGWLDRAEQQAVGGLLWGCSLLAGDHCPFNDIEARNQLIAAMLKLELNYNIQ